MCQRISGDQVTLKERYAWKVVSRSNVWEGPTYNTRVYRGKNPERQGWSQRTRLRRWRALTEGGYHVFRYKKDAVRYAAGVPQLCAIKVHIRGKALPFEGFHGSGWAVEEWRPVTKEEKNDAEERRQASEDR